MVSVDDIKQYVSSANSGTIALGAGAAAVGAGLGAVTALGISSARKKSKRRSSRKRSSKGRSRKKHYHHKNKKRAHRSRKQIHYTKKGNPYIILASGKARFISKRSAKLSKKRKGGRY